MDELNTSQNSSWRYLNIIHETEISLFIPLRTNEIPLQKSGLTCAPYTTLLKMSNKIKKGRDQHFSRGGVGLGGFREVSVTRVRERGKGMLTIKLLSDGPRAYTAKMSTLKIIKQKKALTSLGFSRRCWTIVRRNSSWEILIPLIRSSCSESAKNMQFPSPWLSEIAKPFSNAVLFKACDSSVLLDSMRASRMICWSTIKKGSPVNGRWKKT